MNYTKYQQFETKISKIDISGLKMIKKKYAAWLVVIL